jgi:hypothetical protein
MEYKINILECFDDKIDNLNLFKSYIYVLQLIEDRYYIGRSDNILRRIEEHFTNNGSIYTKKFKPLKVIEVEEEKTNQDEKVKTFFYMEKYGWEKVRGSHWCSLELKKNPINNKKRKYNKSFENMEYKIDDDIQRMYCFKDMNIIEIGEKLDRTPGSIAYRLEQLSIIERRQKARGYYEYITSDLYREICNRKNANREEKKSLIQDVKFLKEEINLIKSDITILKENINKITNHLCK